MHNFVFNETMKLRRETIIKLANLYEKGELKIELPKLVKKILSGPNPKYRDSIYHERAVLSQRIKLYLGLDYQKSKDLELYEIAERLDDILKNKDELVSEKKYVQVVKEACDACPSGKYYISDLCRNCVAHSCKSVCPKNAISIKDGRAVIDPEKCIGCGLCKKACSYYAIVKLERPCEQACFVGALTSGEDYAAEIDYEKCISCGSCYTACPFGAIETPLQLLQVLESIKNQKTVAIFAPSIVAQLGPIVSIGQIKEALCKSGFDNAYEVAIGADEVAEEESEFIENSDFLVTTSCCPAFVDYIEKNQKEYVGNISPAPSPMIALTRQLKKENPNIKIVFIGPCIAKKMEMDKTGEVDFVLSFEELGALFISKKIEPSKLEGNKEINGSFDGWNFASSGGVSQAVINKCNRELKTEKINGIEEAKKVFAGLKNNKCDLLEGMACEGGCIAGPGIMVNPNIAKAMLKRIKK